MNKLTFEEIRKKGLLLYEYKRGSHAYGLNTETSDEDFGGVFMCPIEQLYDLGFEYQEQVANETNDIVWYELNKFMRLLLSSNPTVLESLFIPEDCIVYEHPIMSYIKSFRNTFITKQCFKSFGGYAVTQIEKARGLNKKIVNPIKERLEPLDFCYTFYKQGSTKIVNWLEYRNLKQQYCGLVNIPNMHDVYGCYYDWGNFFLNENITLDDCANSFYNGDYENDALYRMITFIIDKYDLCIDGFVDKTFKEFEYWFKNVKPIGYSGIVGEDKLSNEIRLSSVSKGEIPICYISYNKTGYTKHCIDYKNYKDWEKHRNPVRYESNLDKNYDSKNIMHSFRLISMCTEIANGEGFKCDRRNIDRDFLLEVKGHKYEYEEIMDMLTHKKEIMDEAIKNSQLKDSLEPSFVNNILTNIRKEQIYKYVKES